MDWGIARDRGVFSYFNRNADNVRHKPEWGGGGLLDIGCYPITTSRFMFGAEPLRVSGMLERDPDFGTDRLASAILEFAPGNRFSRAGRNRSPYQRMQFLGTKGRIEIEIPFNAPPDRADANFYRRRKRCDGLGIRAETIPACDQYTVQGDAFSRAIRENTEVPVPLEDAIANMTAIDAIFRSAESGRWEKLSS